MDRIVNLCRLRRSDQGTAGRIFYGDFQCETLELPWRENKRGISCIPAGDYHTEIRMSPKYGPIYWLKDVPERTFILIHWGNWAGDKSKGYKSNVNGCILLGKQRGLLGNQIAVLNSRITVKRFMHEMNKAPFTLRILESF